MRTALLASAAVLATAAAPAASTLAPPQTAYRALLSKPFTRAELPARFAAPRAAKLALPKSLGAVGGVRVGLGGRDAIRYVVFPAHAKAVEQWYSWVTARVGDELYEEDGLLPGSLLPIPRMLLLGVRAGSSIQNKLAFVAGPVFVEVIVTERPGVQQHDKVATIALARAADAHLAAVAR